MSAQHDLFGGSAPVGWTYRDELIDAAEEQALLSTMAAWPLAPAKYKDYTARRKVLSFGGSFDYSTNTLQPGEPIPAALAPLRARVAHWAGLAPEVFTHALVAYYAPGTPLGWHRDVPDFELVAGVSLGGMARMEFRRYPPVPRSDTLHADLSPRSAYLMRGAARWDWQHRIQATETERWSITFRTRRARPDQLT
jgi:alkylated DNA repair dioxygenase AlkB